MDGKRDLKITLKIIPRNNFIEKANGGVGMNKLNQFTWKRPLKAVELIGVSALAN